jgi:hypothetical protein
MMGRPEVRTKSLSWTVKAFAALQEPLHVRNRDDWTVQGGIFVYDRASFAASIGRIPDFHLMLAGFPRTRGSGGD